MTPRKQIDTSYCQCILFCKRSDIAHAIRVGGRNGGILRWVLKIVGWCLRGGQVAQSGKNGLIMCARIISCKWTVVAGALHLQFNVIGHNVAGGHVILRQRGDHPRTKSENLVTKRISPQTWIRSQPAHPFVDKQSQKPPQPQSKLDKKPLYKKPNQ